KFLDALEVERDRFFRVQVDVFEPFHQAADERLAQLRLLLDGAAFTCDHVAEHLHPVILIQHAVDLEALCPQARCDAAEEISLRLDLLLHQRLDQRRCAATLFTFLSSIPVALMKAGQSWKSPLPTSKATV